MPGYGVNNYYKSYLKIAGDINTSNVKAQDFILLFLVNSLNFFKTISYLRFYMLLFIIVYWLKGVRIRNQQPQNLSKVSV